MYNSNLPLIQSSSANIRYISANYIFDNVQCIYNKDAYSINKLPERLRVEKTQKDRIKSELVMEYYNNYSGWKLYTGLDLIHQDKFGVGNSKIMNSKGIYNYRLVIFHFKELRQNLTFYLFNGDFDNRICRIDFAIQFIKDLNLLL